MTSKKHTKLLYVHNADFSTPAANKVQVLNMCEAFSTAGAETTLLAIGTITTPPYRATPNVKKKLLSSTSHYSLRTLRLFKTYLSLPRSDILFTRDIVFCIMAAVFTRTKACYEVHHVQPSALWRFMYRIAHKHAHRLILISEGIKHDLIQKKLPSHNTTILHDGVDIDRFACADKAAARHTLNLPKNAFLIGYVGRTSDDRDIRTLIDATRDLIGVHVVIAGSPLRDDIREPHATILPYTDRPELVYCACDALFAGYTARIPTIHSMSPLKLFEYLAAQKPIIVADFARIREIVSENEVDFYTSEDADSLRTTIQKIQNSTNKKMITQKIRNAYAKAKQHTWLSRAQSILRIFAA